MDEYIQMARRLREVAKLYADNWGDECEGYYTVYDTPTVHEDGTMTFQIGPSTHGMTTAISLPLEYMDDLDAIVEHIRNKRAEIEEDRKARTCPKCGHYKQEWEFSAMGW